MDPHDLDRPDLPLYGTFDGIVIDRNDPLMLGRVRIKIAGLIEEGTGWAPPLGTVGGGSKGRGFFSVPALGSEVTVLFRGGSPDEPRYVSSGWGKPLNADGIRESDVPEAARDLGVEETPNVSAFETDKFEMVYNDNAAGSCRVKHKTTGSEFSIDGATGSVSLTALGNIEINATAQVFINGLVVSINGVPAGTGRL